MTGAERDPVRNLLQQIAASAGDPPEHGLEGVAARRRRRARHRRGAVATAVALAVLVVGVAPWLRSLGARDDVTAADSGETAPEHASLPAVLTVRCTPDGIDVPVASIQPQADGLHIVVHNQLPGPTQVWVRSDDWDSGMLVVGRGRSELRQPVPPGALTVGCRIGNEEQPRSVDLVDVAGVYDEPELGCSRRDQAPALEDVVIDNPTSSYVEAVKQVLADSWREGDRVHAHGGYEAENLGDVRKNPTVRVERDGEVVAFVTLAPAEEAPLPQTTRPMWASAVLVEGCTSYLTPADQATSTSGG